MIKVSVLVVTYNHYDYIDTALESVFDQVCNFDFEVVISEDASHDGTREKVMAWQQRYPERTRLFFSSENLHSNEVVRRGFHAARGDYVALLDGDDYYTSRHKIAQQAAVLDCDPRLSLCFHNAVVIDRDEKIGPCWTDPNLKRRLKLADLWEGNPFATCGSMFRRDAVPHIPEWYCDFFPITDWPLYVLFAEAGDIAFVPEITGAYRQHSAGYFSSKTAAEKLRSMDDVYRRLNEVMGGRHDAALRLGHHRYFAGMARHYLDIGQMDLARAALAYARSYSGSSFRNRVELLALGGRALITRAEHQL